MVRAVVFIIRSRYEHFDSIKTLKEEQHTRKDCTLFYKNDLPETSADISGRVGKR